MMSLNTLIEAAKYLEMQEQQQRAANAAPKPQLPPTQPHVPAVLIATSEIAPNLLTLAQETIKTQAEQQQVSDGVGFVRRTNGEDVVQVISSTVNKTSQQRILHNSFDITNSMIADDATGEMKRKQPPMVFRSGTREVHNKLEKHRRAHLKECFDVLKKQIPQTQDDKKTSNLSILHSALRFIQSLKRKERELEHEMERLARDKIASQQRLALMKREITTQFDNVDFSKLLPDVKQELPAYDDVKMEPDDDVVKGEGDRVHIPLLPNKTTQIAIAASQVKEVAQPVQTTALSVLPVGYSVPQGLVLQKLIVPKGLTEIAPLVSTHFITQQQINGKVVPLVNQYVVKPVVVVSRPS